ncbi:hypothetical protein BKP45_15210 [Anaerobacillus alkalidiazotrophicus]|uniref:UDP-N-acetylmuramyl-tripeptide synthetase n=1 Tax=Anaerobacillus alkalidiazotrophicus TaxID=472963 RepID=A0A1S2M4T1_9BACI|nr:UDP-N-acetylmuramoyl-L-alanyl-D-glutamate--2,6-diaminopimelate ligase [Anaerobacillus alkalidiazotrophicus]OIJ18877.1 hypothetical protein BKP45_15210 [Anaerobacillus alkalidiazotrophicus]
MSERRLHDIVKSLNNLRYTGIQSNSKLIERGNVFVAINGNAIDGHQYIQDAITRGAIAIVGEKDMNGLPIPYFKVENSRKVLGNLASHYYCNPSKKHTVVAVTGTNGKTTTSYLIRHILNTVGESCSLFGTVEHVINDQKIPALNTTPDTLVLQKMLSESNDSYVVMEASSHGIDQHRLEGTSIDYGLFTNLSHEHLDYHGTLDSYFKAKSKLFELMNKNGEAIVGSYTNWGERLISQLENERKHVFSFGEKDKDQLQLLEIKTYEKPTFVIKDGIHTYTLFSILPGIHNIWNTMQAYLTARRLGLEPEEIIHALQTFQGVPGRFEQYNHPNNAKFIVDYAHSPDALIHCLSTSRNLTKGKLFHIFGFRGKRDQQKRLPMLKASTNLCNETILTLDDLNGEDINDMTAQMNELINKCDNKKCKVIVDRTEAIKYAWGVVEGDDTVLITGKGPELYKHQFTLPSTSDRETLNYLEHSG